LKEIQTPPVVTTDFVCVRFIGDRSIQEKDFGRIQIDQIAEMQKWANTVKNLERDGRVKLSIIAANNHVFELLSNFAMHLPIIVLMYLSERIMSDAISVLIRSFPMSSTVEYKIFLTSSSLEIPTEFICQSNMFISLIWEMNDT